MGSNRWTLRRQPPGVPTGGQFAPDARPHSGVHLDVKEFRNYGDITDRDIAGELSETEADRYGISSYDASTKDARAERRTIDKTLSSGGAVPSYASAFARRVIGDVRADRRSRLWMSQSDDGPVNRAPKAGDRLALGEAMIDSALVSADAEHAAMAAGNSGTENSDRPEVSAQQFVAAEQVAALQAQQARQRAAVVGVVADLRTQADWFAQAVIDSPHQDVVARRALRRAYTESANKIAAAIDITDAEIVEHRAAESG